MTGHLPIQPPFVPSAPAPVATVRPPTSQAPVVGTSGPILSVSFGQQRANVAATSVPAPAAQVAQVSQVVPTTAIAPVVPTTAPTGGVLGEFVEADPLSGVLGEVEVRTSEILPEIVSEPLAEILEVTRLPRTGGVPPTQLLGLLGLILASAGLALRRRSQ